MAARVPCLASCVVASACATPKPVEVVSAPTAPVDTATVEAPSPPAARTSVTAPSRMTAPQEFAEDHEPPQIISAVLQDKGVDLHFSEPLAPVDEIDPEQFRLSVGAAEYDEGDAYTYFIEVGQFAELDAPLRVSGLALDETGHQLKLTFSQRVPAKFCERLAEERADAAKDEMQFGLFLHYAPLPGANVSDRAGNAMAAQGARWVTSRSETMEITFTATSGQQLFAGLTDVQCPADIKGAALAWRTSPSPSG